MSSEQFILNESCLVPEVRFGCMRIEHADQLPLDMVNFVVQPGNVTLALDGATGKPGIMDSFVAINTFQFPKGMSEFERVVEWFGRDRKSRAKLPEGIKFDENVLALHAAPADWEHEAYPQSNRTFVHIYRGPKQAVLIRWLARTGMILEHPLFKPLLENLRVVPGQWVTDSPAIQPKAEKHEVITGTPLTEDLRHEIEVSAARAREALQLGRVRKPARVAEFICEAIDQLRSRKTGKAEKSQFAIDCGALWGQALSEATGWEWQRLTGEQGETGFAVCSPNRSHAVFPLKVVYDLATHPAAENNSLLLFNMIATGKVPVSTEGAYSLLR